MKIGILGGTFDPPHIGHLIAATQIQERLSLDEMWLMPVSTHAFNKTLSPARHRLAMTKLLEKGSVFASDFEIKRGDVSSTYHTMKYLRESRPDDTFYFCMGSDLLDDFHTWNDWKELILENMIVIYPRGGDMKDFARNTMKTMGKERMSQIKLIEGPDILVTSISSSIVRTRMREGKSIEYLVPTEVISYINNYSLYR